MCALYVSWLATMMNDLSSRALSRSVAICHKSWESRPEPTGSPFVSPFSFSLMVCQGFWAEPAHPLPNILMQFIQSNSLIKSTLMFTVLSGSTEISVYAELSHCR